MAIVGEGGSLNRSVADEQMRRPLSITLASLFVAVLVASPAQAATRRYDFQNFQGGSPGQLAIQITVFYKNKQRHGIYTPRQAIYESYVPISCTPPVGAATAPSGSYIRGTPNYNFIKLRKGSFTYSDSSEVPVSSGPPGSISATLTGKVIKKKPNVSKQLRVDGSVSILDYNLPPLGYHDCTSGGPVPYSATPCRLFGGHPPSYIKPSLPVCFGGP
jgi:hypothetical protein